MNRRVCTTRSTETPRRRLLRLPERMLLLLRSLLIVTKIIRWQLLHACQKQLIAWGDPMLTPVRYPMNRREGEIMLEVVLRRFDAPDEIRKMPKGRFEIIRMGGMTIGRATYEPGWRWSEHVGPSVGTSRCGVEHIGLVLSGTATAAFEDGQVVELRAGELFHIPARPHDSWVVGDQPYISLHFMGADHYAR
jgi:hypothetical protein